MRKRFGLSFLVLSLCGCALLATPEDQYNDAFPDKYPFNYFHNPGSRDLQNNGITNPFALDTLPSSGATSLAVYKINFSKTSPRALGNDTVEICTAAGCTKKPIQALNLSPKAGAILNFNGVQSLIWKSGRLWVIRRFYGDPEDTVFEVDLAKGILDYSVRDSVYGSLPVDYAQPYGVDSLRRDTLARDADGNEYHLSYIVRRPPEGGYQPTTKVTKTDPSGTVQWETEVSMHAIVALCDGGALYLGGNTESNTEFTSNSSATLAKITGTGLVTWLKSYHAAHVDKQESITSLAKGGDNEVIALGYSGADAASSNFVYLLRTDTAGTALSERLYAPPDKNLVTGQARLMRVDGKTIRFAMESGYVAVSMGGFYTYGEVER